MISGGFIEDTPRLGTADVRMLLPSDANLAILELEVDTDGLTMFRSLTLTTTPLPQPGARRWWWLCPRCGKRRVHLYLIVARHEHTPA